MSQVVDAAIRRAVSAAAGGRALVGVTIAWVMAVVIAYVGLPAVEGRGSAHLASAATGGWWASPILSWPILGLYIWAVRGKTPWWRESRWAFAGLILLVFVLCGFVGGGAVALMTIITGHPAIVVAEGLAGVMLWVLWTGQLFWGLVAGLLLAPSAGKSRPRRA